MPGTLVQLASQLARSPPGSDRCREVRPRARGAYWEVKLKTARKRLSTRSSQASRWRRSRTTIRAPTSDRTSASRMPMAWWLATSSIRFSPLNRASATAARASATDTTHSAQASRVAAGRVAGAASVTVAPPRCVVAVECRPSPSRHHYGRRRGWTGCLPRRRVASMSGPVGVADAPPTETQASTVTPACVEITPSRESVVGAMRVRRALPRIGRRTVGAWCFADHMGPELVTETRGLDIGPHPHTGLHTVTRRVAGGVLHRDRAGSDQVIRAGQLNLMSAGQGVTHSEEATGRYRGQLHGVQLWVAQPEATRHGPAAFEHHAELPRVELDNAVATVLVGSFAGATSPARRDTALVGADVARGPGTGAWPLAPSFEHALVVLEGEVLAGDQVVRPGQLAYLGVGRAELVLSAAERARVLLLGGEPFGEAVLMWWNFVVRGRDELDRAYRQWESGDPRFGRLRSPLVRIPAPKPFWPRPT